MAHIRMSNGAAADDPSHGVLCVRHESCESLCDLDASDSRDSHLARAIEYSMRDMSHVSPSH